MRQLGDILTLSYPLKSDLPHQRTLWTILIVIGSILGTFFAFVGVATTGYNLQPQYTTDPNTTESNRQWFQQAPFSWLGTMDTTCQDSLFGTGDTLMTTNGAFVYTLAGVAAVPDKNTSSAQPLARLSYKDSVLTQCEIYKIELYLTRTIPDVNTGQWWIWGATTAQASISCIVSNSHSDIGMVRANFTLALPQVQGDNEAFFTSNAASGAKSIHYGMMLLSSWYHTAAGTMAYTSPGAVFGTEYDSYAYGRVQLNRNQEVTDWQRQDFFMVNAAFDTTAGLGCHTDSSTWNFTTWQQSGTTAPYYLPGNWMSYEAFGKSFYSLLASDFGITDGSNALLTSTGVQYLQNLNDTYAYEAYQKCQAELSIGFCSSGTGPTFTIDSRDDLTDLPSARIVTQYLCSIPSPKSRVSIAYTVILSMLVFLHATYALFLLVARLVLVKPDQENVECSNCVSARGRGQEESLLPQRPPLQSNSSSFHDIEMAQMDRGSDDDNALLVPNATYQTVPERRWHPLHFFRTILSRHRT